MAKKTKTGKIAIKEIVETANTSQYCLNCQFSYLHAETGHGYCTYKNDDRPVMYMKPIKEFDTCNHWEKK